MIRTYLLFDPQHDDAIALMERAYAQHGLRAVCLYSNMRAEMFAREQFPQLSSQRVLASYFTEQWTPAALAYELTSKFEVRGVMPFSASTTSACAELLGELDLPWARPALLRRFRNRHVLRETLRQAVPRAGLLPSRLVYNTQDVLSAALPARFVLQPNGSTERQGAGYFQTPLSQSALDAYFASAPAGAHVLEPHVDGPTYTVTGQMDERGQALVIGILHEQPEQRLAHVRQTAPEFAPISRTVRLLMEATGLARCPFHMRVVLTPSGPQLLEAAPHWDPRYTTQAANSVHGPGFDIHALAAHHFLVDAPQTCVRLDWAHHDQVDLLLVQGTSTHSAHLRSLQGMERVEALPEFRGWLVAPVQARGVRPELGGMRVPYALQIMSQGDGTPLAQVANHIELLLQGSGLGRHTHLRQAPRRWSDTA